MPVISDLPTWISISSSLLQANPTTTKITTRYSTKTPKKRTKTDAGGKGVEDTKKSDVGSSKKKAGFTVKTHDTASNATFVFRTTKASDLGMVMRTMHGLGADMAGVARPKATDLTKAAAEEEEKDATPATATASNSAAAATAGDDADGKTSSKKKKKGKKR